MAAKFLVDATIATVEPVLRFENVAELGQVLAVVDGHASRVRTGFLLKVCKWELPYEFVAGKAAVVELREEVNKVSSLPSKSYGVLVSWDNQDLIVTEVLFIEPDTISFRHLPVGVESTNTLVIGNGYPVIHAVSISLLLDLVKSPSQNNCDRKKHGA